MPDRMFRTVAAVILLLSWRAFADESGPGAPGIARLTVRDASAIHVLQLTDLHYFSRDPSTREAFNARTTEQIQALIEHARPDLVVITGDVWSENPNGAGEAQLRYAVEQFATLGVPWAFTWGNHDQVSDRTRANAILRNAPNSLYRGEGEESHYRIDLVSPSGERLWQLLLIDTGREGLVGSRREWVRRLSPVEAPRLAFFHIPLKQYATVWEEGTATGIWGETPCFEREDGGALAALRDAGVVACFCGHDHMNDYSGRVDGVELVYGRVSRAGGYGADTFDKGGKLIILNGLNRTCRWESITPDGRRWHPGPAERLVMTETH
ncbi:MAG TPA: metallophosphoesterase family protein [Candidatus Hydrogenedentes bacterium]|nr:metallophosphoesterase family protein [Candidatus Hydrogenedentota bacterium]HOK90394.1 metallophosphoesterase family protein [Candidatus Hydrogenedentota bacterium]